MTGKPWRPSMPQEARESLEKHEEEMLADRATRLEGASDVFKTLADGPRYFDREGERISMADWVEAMDDFDYVRIGNDIVGDIEISTVWLGLDMALSMQLPPIPLICETAVFRVIADHRLEFLVLKRYPNAAAALRGHEEFVKIAEVRGIYREADD